jgi:hypothetical protein
LNALEHTANSAQLGIRHGQAAVHARELKRSDANQATLAVARKLVAYLLAVDRSQQPFQIREPEAIVA